MKVTDLRGKSVSDLNVELVKQLEQQFKLSMRKATGQLAQTHLLKAAKKDVARIKTVINEKAVK